MFGRKLWALAIPLALLSWGVVQAQERIGEETCSTDASKVKMAQVVGRSTVPPENFDDAVVTYTQPMTLVYSMRGDQWAIAAIGKRVDQRLFNGSLVKMKRRILYALRKGKSAGVP